MGFNSAFKGLMPATFRELYQLSHFVNSCLCSPIHTARSVNVTAVAAHPPALPTDAVQQTVKHMRNTEVAQSVS